MNSSNGTGAPSEIIDAHARERLESPDLWHRLDQYRASVVSPPTAQVDESERTVLVNGLLNDIELRMLFIAVDYAHLHGDEAKRGAINASLMSVFGSSVGPELYQSNPETITFFLAGLHHPAATVRKLTAKTIEVLGRTQAEGREERCRSLLRPPLLSGLVAGLRDFDTGAAQAVAQALVALSEASAAGRKAVLEALVAQLDDAVSGLSEREAATPRLRFADTAARLMSSSEAAFREAEEAGAVSLVTSLTQDSSDVLLQLNALDLLEQVASSAGGARYLAREGHLVALLAAAGGGEGEEPGFPDPLLGSSALRILGKVLAKAAGAGLEIEPPLLRGFLRACTVHMESGDETSKVGGMVAVSSLAEVSSPALKEMLAGAEGAGGVLDAWLVLSRHKVNEKAAALHAVAKVLGPPPLLSEPPSERAQDSVAGDAAATGGRGERSALVRRLFDRLGSCNRQATGALLLGLAKQPVPEVRHAAHDVLRCTVWQPGGWSLAAMFSQPGFREFLEERDTGSSKVTKEWKFSVVESVMQCQDRGILGQDILDSFRRILKQGPFWVPSMNHEVATVP